MKEKMRYAVVLAVSLIIFFTVGNLTNAFAETVALVALGISGGQRAEVLGLLGLQVVHVRPCSACGGRT